MSESPVPSLFSAPPFTVLGIGSLPFDVLCYRQSETGPLIQKIEMPGGCVNNVLSALRLFGHAVRVVAVVGDDNEGAAIGGHLRHFGVDTRWLQTRENRDTRRLEIDFWEDGSGHTCHKVHHFSKSSRICSPKDIVFQGWRRQALRECHWFHFDATNKNTVLFAERAAREGHPVSFDFGHFPRWGMNWQWRLLEACTALKTNRHLLPSLCGSTETAPLFHRFPQMRFALVTDGQAGLELAWRAGEETRHFSRPVIPLARMEDTLGAGDATAALFIHALGSLIFQDKEPDEKWGRTVLDHLSAFAGLACQYPTACGHLFALQKANLPDLLARIIRDNQAPAEWSRKRQDFFEGLFPEPQNNDCFS